MVRRLGVLLAMLRVLSYAQTGSVQGRVVDPIEAVMPNADVVLRTKADATIVQNTRTDLHGRSVSRPSHLETTNCPFLCRDS